MDDTDHLRDVQYADRSRLDARRRLHARWSTAEVDWSVWLFDRLPANVGEMLELGAGTGELWRANRDRVPPGWALTVTDLAPSMVEAAQEVLGERPNTRFGVADVRDLPYPDASFDTVMMNHALYHLSDTARGLSEIRRVLRPGGRLIASTNGPSHMFELDLLGATGLGSAGDPSQRFGLVTGYPQLLRMFRRVEVSTFDDSIAAVGAEGEADVVAYVASTVPSATEDELASVSEAVSARRRRSSDDTIRITKEVGVFIAEDPR